MFTGIYMHRQKLAFIHRNRWFSDASTHLCTPSGACQKRREEDESEEIHLADVFCVWV